MKRTSLLRWWGPCILIAGLSASPRYANGEMIGAAEALATLSGYVYADINNNGRRDFFEMGISGVEVLLQGLQATGDIVKLTTLTDERGDYRFTNLAPGDYSVTETQPLKFIQGKENEVGSAGGAALGSDRFTEIDLTAGAAAMHYNFGEWGLKARYVSKADLLTLEPSTLVTLATALVALTAFVRFRRRS
jgi:hypothetical protein